MSMKTKAIACIMMVASLAYGQSSTFPYPVYFGSNVYLPDLPTVDLVSRLPTGEVLSVVGASVYPDQIYNFPQGGSFDGNLALRTNDITGVKNISGQTAAFIDLSVSRTSTLSVATCNTATVGRLDATTLTATTLTSTFARAASALFETAVISNATISALTLGESLAFDTLTVTNDLTVLGDTISTRYDFNDYVSGGYTNQWAIYPTENESESGGYELAIELLVDDVTNKVFLAYNGGGLDFECANIKCDNIDAEYAEILEIVTDEITCSTTGRFSGVASFGSSVYMSGLTTNANNAGDNGLYKYVAGSSYLVGWNPPGGGGGGEDTLATLASDQTFTGANTFSGTISNSYNVATPYAKFHRVESNVFASAEVWTDIGWDLAPATENSFGITTNAGGVEIVFSFDGQVNIDGCVRPQWLGADNDPAWIASRVVWTTNAWANTNEARCLQSYESRLRQQGEMDTTAYKGSLHVSPSTQIKLQAQVSSTDLILQGQSVFDNPVAASINIYSDGK